MKRKMVMLAVLMTACLCLGIAANAMVMWTNITKMSVNFSQTGATGLIVGKSGTTYISGTLTVYIQNSSGGWTYVTSGSGSSSSISLSIPTSFTPVSGGYYKAVLSASVTANGTTESASTTVYHQY